MDETFFFRGMEKKIKEKQEKIGILDTGVFFQYSYSNNT